MSGAEIMSGAESRKWVHQKPTNQPTWSLASLHGLTVVRSTQTAYNHRCPKTY